MIGQVYCVTNLINGKKYIGQNKSCNPAYLGSGKLIRLAIKKYGKENFIKDILWEGPIEFINEMELYWIEYFMADTNPQFYNICKDANPPVLFGMLNGFYNKNHSEESKKKIRNARSRQTNVNYIAGLEKMNSEESILKRANTFKKKYDEGLIKHWSKGQTKHTNIKLAELGKRISETQRGRSSKTKKAIICNELNLVFESLTLAAAELNIKQGDISNMLSGRQKTVKGYTFAYL
jgi:group I intron endonuclease